jgi:hypothetical protein
MLQLKQKIRIVKRSGHTGECHRLELREVHDSILKVAQEWCKSAGMPSRKIRSALEVNQ